MSFINKSILIAFICFIVGCVATDAAIGMKLLVLSTQEPESVIRALQSYSIDYDYIEYNAKNPLEGDLPLYNEDMQPKYYGVVLGNGALTVYHEDTKAWGSILSQSQWDYLKDYQKKYGVRVVALDDSPSSAYGTAIFDANIWGVSSTQEMKMVDNEIAKAIYKEAGIKTTVTLDTQGLYHVPVRITDEKIATPIISLQPNEDVKEESTVVVYTKTEEGIERLSFYISFGEWSLNSVMLNHLWVSWVTRSLYAGQRIVTFTPHVDDVFLSTGLLNFETNELESAENAYRTTIEDFKILKDWQDNIVKELPEGSFIRCELAFNGNGILSAIDPSVALNVDGERYCDIEFKNPPGSGVDRWYIANYTLPAKEYLELDDLFTYFEKEENNKEFFWSSHTFTHENLDQASATDANNEIGVNIEMAKRLGIYEKSNYSGKSIITPQISGLRNVDVLEIFKKYGIESGTGDLSRPGLCNIKNPYLPFITTQESSNYDGFPIIPRSPTEVYYSSSNIEENTHIYNIMYKDVVGESTWEQILNREINRAVTLMMKLRNEAHQFHQINLRSYDIEGKESLLQKWSNAVLKKYTSLVDWPVISLKLDDQAKLYIDRYNRETYCDVSKSAVLEGDYITAIIVNPKSIEHDCKIPITLPQNVEKNKNQTKVTYEKRGKDHLVAWIDFKKGDKTPEIITLNPPLAWNSGAEVKQEQPTCWSEDFGFKCCEKGESIVEYIDENGWWGVTDQQEWCGIIRNETCWSEDFGLPCCESDKLDFVLENGVIGYEDKYENDSSRPAGGWCGIKSAANLVYNNAAELFKQQLSH